MEITDDKKIIEQNQPPVVIPQEDLKEFVLKKISEKFTDFTRKELKELENKFNERVENKEMKTTEILAIFITLFTFISVNVNIFTKVSDVYTAIWFMLLMTACSVLLLSFLFLIIRSKNNWKVWVGLMIVLAFITFLILVTISGNWNPKLNEGKNETKSVKIIQ